MMPTPSNIPWARIAAESAAIVASILLAFAIDAWWEQRIDHHRSLAQLSTIKAEFVEVERQLARADQRLVGMRKAVAELLSHIGPQTPVESMDSLASMIDMTFRGARIELPTGSMQALLASGELSNVTNHRLRALLATWPAEVVRLRNQSGLLEENREEIIRYMHDKIPTLAIARNTNQMNAYPESSFDVDPEIVQRDIRVEGLFGNRGMMIEDTLVIVADLRTSVAESLSLIDTQLSE